MSSLDNHLSDKIVDILKTLNIKYLSREEFFSIDAIYFTEAAYYPTHDLITMDIQQMIWSAFTVNQAMLHELIHWTGHSTRLNRIGIATAEKMKPYGEIEYQNEETIAQYGMYYLGVELGFKEKELRQIRDRFKKDFMFADINKCSFKGKQAARYIMKLYKNGKTK